MVVQSLSRPPSGSVWLSTLAVLQCVPNRRFETLDVRRETYAVQGHQQDRREVREVGLPRVRTLQAIGSLHPIDRVGPK